MDHVFSKIRLSKKVKKLIKDNPRKARELLHKLTHPDDRSTLKEGDEPESQPRGSADCEYCGGPTLWKNNRWQCEWCGRVMLNYEIPDQTEGEE